MCHKLADEINICLQCNSLNPKLSTSPSTKQSLADNEVSVCVLTQTHTYSCTCISCICVFTVGNEAPWEIKAAKVGVVSSVTPVSNCLSDLASVNVLCAKRTE